MAAGGQVTASGSMPVCLTAVAVRPGIRMPGAVLSLPGIDDFEVAQRLRVMGAHAHRVPSLLAVPHPILPTLSGYVPPVAPFCWILAIRTRRPVVLIAP